MMMSAIGDAVQVLPLVSALRRCLPEARITWVIQPVPHQLVHNHPEVDDFILFRRRRGLDAWEGFAEVAREMRERDFDLLLGLQVYFKAGILTHLAPAKAKLGFDRKRARDMNWLFTTHRIPPHPYQHIQDQYLEFLEFLGVRAEPLTYHIPLTDQEQEAQADFFGGLDRPACAVVVGTSKREKNWSPEGLARVLEEVDTTHGLQPVLVGGPSPVERELADRVTALTKAHPIDTLGNDLRRLLYTVAGSALVISPDTGPLHIARALEVPVVGLYGYTNPKRSGPYRLFTDLVVDGYARYQGEEYPISMEYRNGMMRVTVDAVLEKVTLAVEKYLA
jgi:heptosyltransferase I